MIAGEQVFSVPQQHEMPRRMPGREMNRARSHAVDRVTLEDDLGIPLGFRIQLMNDTFRFEMARIAMGVADIVSVSQEDVAYASPLLEFPDQVRHEAGASTSQFPVSDRMK
jgi:hypothetical protein